MSFDLYIGPFEWILVAIAVLLFVTGHWFIAVLVLAGMMLLSPPHDPDQASPA